MAWDDDPTMTELLKTNAAKMALEARLAAQSPIVEWVAEMDFRAGEHDAMRDRARALLGRSDSEVAAQPSGEGQQ